MGLSAKQKADLEKAADKLMSVVGWLEGDKRENTRKSLEAEPDEESIYLNAIKQTESLIKDVYFTINTIQDALDDRLHCGCRSSTGCLCKSVQGRQD